MPNETRSTSEIEHAIEENRAALTADLEILQEKLSLDGIIRQATGQLREHGGEIANSFSAGLRENPMAATMIAVGIGWMIFGGRKGAPASTSADHPVPEFRPAPIEPRPAPAAAAPRPDPSPEWARDDNWGANDDWRH